MSSLGNFKCTETEHRTKDLTFLFREVLSTMCIIGKCGCKDVFDSSRLSSVILRLQYFVRHQSSGVFTLH